MFGGRPSRYPLREFYTGATPECTSALRGRTGATKKNCLRDPQAGFASPLLTIFWTFLLFDQFPRKAASQCKFAKCAPQKNQSRPSHEGREDSERTHESIMVLLLQTLFLSFYIVSTRRVLLNTCYNTTQQHKSTQLTRFKPDSRKLSA